MSEDANGEPFVGKITQKAILFAPDGEVLLTRSGDHWEPPGGTFEYRETLVDGLRRELREELGVEGRVGPPVETMYGGWIDEETYNPMVTLVYRCETDEREVTLNDEHDDYEWLSPTEASERLATAFEGPENEFEGAAELDAVFDRLATAVERAAALDDGKPFETVRDPYADTNLTSDEMLAALADARSREPPDDVP